MRALAFAHKPGVAHTPIIQIITAPFHFRAICAGCVRALAFVHERGVAHGSLGSGAVLLSHVDDRKAGQLVVKLDNFGFAQRQVLPPGMSIFV